MDRRKTKYSAKCDLDGLTLIINATPKYDYPKSTTVLAYIPIPGDVYVGYYTHECDLNIINARRQADIIPEFINEPTQYCKLKITYNYGTKTDSIILNAAWNNNYEALKKYHDSINYAVIRKNGSADWWEKWHSNDTPL